MPHARLILADTEALARYAGVMKVLGGNCCFAANSFYCLRLPIHPLLEGGDPNAMLGVHKSPWGLMLLRSKLFYSLRLPIHPMLGGGDLNGMLGVIAASQQTLFIVSGSQSIEC